MKNRTSDRIVKKNKCNIDHISLFPGSSRNCFVWRVQLKKRILRQLRCQFSPHTFSTYDPIDLSLSLKQV